jgi:hypothetical protein
MKTQIIKHLSIKRNLNTLLIAAIVITLALVAEKHMQVVVQTLQQLIQ